MTSFEQFKKLSTAGNVIPIFETRFADTETPVSVYLKIQKESPYSFLLESVEGGERLGRYSFIGFNPFMSFSIRDKGFELKSFHDDVKVLPTLVSNDDHPLAALKKIFQAHGLKRDSVLRALAMMQRSDSSICSFTSRSWVISISRQARASFGTRVSVASVILAISVSNPLRPTGATRPNSDM